MKNTFGNNISVTLFGESHGEAIGAVVDGLPSGIRIDDDFINSKMMQRAARSDISTDRREPDVVKLISGVLNGYTTGTPICIMIENKSVQSADYSALSDTPRPSHADYAAYAKWGEFRDWRGGGHFSGRITAPLVAAGSIIAYALRQKGVFIGTHISELHGVCDRHFDNYTDDINLLDKKLFPVLDDQREARMAEEISKARAEGDSLGGILESVIVGLEAGVGEPWFDTVEGLLAHALFSIPGIKAVEFGAGFAFADMKGSEANDPLCIDNGKICTETNNNGGVNGGITNGMPILFRTAVKPTPSIFKNQKTVRISTGEETILSLKGRHDPAIIHRARAVVDAISAIVIADLLVSKHGTDWLR